MEKGKNISVGAPFGEPGGGSFTGAFGKQMMEDSGNVESLIKLIGLFLGPDDVRSLSLGVIWDFCEVLGFP